MEPEKTMDIFTQDSIEQAKALGYLTCTGAEQALIFSFKAEMKKLGAPAVVLIEHPRHLEITAMLNNSALIERAKVHVSARCILAMSPFCLMLCNDRRLIVTMLTYSEGDYLVRWLVDQLNNPANLKIGEFSERNHDRIEARKRGDGSLVVNAGAAYIPAQMRIAA